MQIFKVLTFIHNVCTVFLGSTPISDRILAICWHFGPRNDKEKYQFFENCIKKPKGSHADCGLNQIPYPLQCKPGVLFFKIGFGVRFYSNLTPMGL